MEPTINLYNGDCMEAMRAMKDKAYDLAICDPNYGINISSRRYMGGRKDGSSWAIQKNGSKLPVKRNAYERKDWDLTRPDELYFIELCRVSKHQIIWGGNYFTDLLPPSSAWIVWDKEQSGNYSDCELAWTSFAGGVHKITVRWNGMIQYDMANKEDRIHPTQKPIPLYKEVIKKYAKPGNKILDTHGGSMSIAIACFDMGFDLDLWEIDKDYYEAGVRRFNDHKKQLKLFRA